MKSETLRLTHNPTLPIDKVDIVTQNYGSNPPLQKKKKKKFPHFSWGPRSIIMGRALQLGWLNFLVLIVRGPNLDETIICFPSFKFQPDPHTNLLLRDLKHTQKD
jgi:hypothetical protein